MNQDREIDSRLLIENSQHLLCFELFDYTLMLMGPFCERHSTHTVRQPKAMFKALCSIAVVGRAVAQELSQHACFPHTSP